MDIGIDLGTTFSVIAVNGRATLSDGYPGGFYLEECDVTIIPTPEGERTFPSAVWEDPQQSGRLVVGLEAALKVDDGYAPILFSKRKIGTAEAIPLENRTFTAREAAREILRYLKSCAEQALGQPVERAVVTHPAYFDRSQVEETRKAALEAGFDMSQPEQMLMEPVAAALTYTRTDKRDPLRILAYDLGGGTLDVTYLERREGVIYMRAFDGDHLLGGYNFDRELVHWLRKRLEAKGRSVVFDEAKAEDRGRLAQLLRMAEQTKIRLAEARSDDEKITIRIPDLLVDSEGRRLSVLETITRREFVELIKPYLDTTLECCRRTLQKAAVAPAELDEILLVGGSTYGPWIHEIIRREYPGKQFRLFFPEFCVGAGAAIYATMVLPSTIMHARYRLSLDVPAKSVLEVLDIPGKVEAVDGPLPGGLTATLRLPTGRKLDPAPVAADGTFRFTEVVLAPGESNSFVLIIRGADGRDILEHAFEIHYDPDTTDTTTVTTVLPKPLYLETLDGLVPLATEGLALPAQCDCALIRDNDNPNISIRIFQDAQPIGAIRIEDIPPEGGRGSRVEIRVIVTEKNQIRGSAKIINHAGRLVTAADVLVSFDIPEIPTLGELTQHLTSLLQQYAEVLQSEDEDERKALDTAPPLFERVCRLMEQQPLERAEVHAALQQLHQVLNPPRDDMEPTRKQFVHGLAACRTAVDQMVASAETALAQHAGDPGQIAGTGRTPGFSRPEDDPLAGKEGVLDRAMAAIQKAGAFRKMLDKIEQSGIAAHERKDRKAWAAAQDSLRTVQSQVQKRPDIEPPAILLKIFAAVSVDREQARLVTQGRMLAQEERLADWEDELERLGAALQRVRSEVMAVDDGLPSERVRAQLAIILTQRLEPIKQAIERVGKDTRRA